MPAVDARAIVLTLRGGPATLDALHARLREPERESLGWALDDAVARGWVESSAAANCGPDGVCSMSAPAVFALTPAAVRRSERPGVSAAGGPSTLHANHRP